jgi:hypothetical protein
MHCPVMGEFLSHFPFFDRAIIIAYEFGRIKMRKKPDPGDMDLILYCSVTI